MSVGAGFSKFGHFTFGDWNSAYTDRLNDMKKAGTLNHTNLYQKATGAYKDVYALHAAEKTIKAANITATLLKSGKDATKFNIARESLKQGSIQFGKEFSAAAGIIGKTKFLGKALWNKLPFLANLLYLVDECPALKAAYKNGDFGRQIGRSTIHIAGSASGFSGGMAVGGAIGTLCCPVVGTILGMVIGAVGGAIGGKLSEKVGNWVFGKSIEDQKKEGITGNSRKQNLQKAIAQCQNNHPVQRELCTRRDSDPTEGLSGIEYNPFRDEMI